MRLDLFKEQVAEAGKPLQPTGERSYLGLSGWHDCQRNLYHKAKGTPRKPIESRIYRIFKQYRVIGSSFAIINYFIKKMNIKSKCVFIFVLFSFYSI